MSKKLYLLDALALIYRAYYALIRNPRITSTGINTNAQFGFTNTLLEIIKKENPSHFILLTFFSPSGYEVRKNYAGADYVSYLPLDGYFNSARFLDLVKPSLAVFVKYEFWFNYLNELKYFAQSVRCLLHIYH